MKKSRWFRKRASKLESKSDTKATAHEDVNLTVKAKDSSIDQSVIGSFVAIFSFSFFVGLSLMHLSMCWQRLQQEDLFFAPLHSMEEKMHHYYGFDFPVNLNAGLRVNTSFYMH